MEDKIKFVIKEGAAVEEFVVTGYARTFRGQPPPYECTREEWDGYLYPSGLFELAKKKQGDSPPSGMGTVPFPNPKRSE